MNLRTHDMMQIVVFACELWEKRPNALVRFTQTIWFFFCFTSCELLCTDARNMLHFLGWIVACAQAKKVQHKIDPYFSITCEFSHLPTLAFIGTVTHFKSKSLGSNHNILTHETVHLSKQLGNWIECTRCARQAIEMNKTRQYGIVGIGAVVLSRAHFSRQISNKPIIMIVQTKCTTNYAHWVSNAAKKKNEEGEHTHGTAQWPRVVWLLLANSFSFNFWGNLVNFSNKKKKTTEHIASSTSKFRLFMNCIQYCLD